MDISLDPLTDDEFNELDKFLVCDVDTDDGMTLDIMDGFLHAIAIGPTNLHPKQWLPKVWGTEEVMPPIDSIDRMKHIIDLVLRHFNSIIAGLDSEPCEIYPLFPIFTYQDKEYDDAEGWAYGFVEGMKLCWNDWQPMLETPEGQAWFRPIGLLGEDEFGPDQDALTETPAQRAELTLQITEAIEAMHAFWLPLRHAVYQREVAKTMQPKVGRNDPCPCGSGKKFKKCCGAAANLH